MNLVTTLGMMLSSIALSTSTPAPQDKPADTYTVEDCIRTALERA